MADLPIIEANTGSAPASPETEPQMPASAPLRILPPLAGTPRVLSPAAQHQRRRLHTVQAAGMGILGALFGWMVVVLFFMNDPFYFNPFRLVLGVGWGVPAIPGAMIGLLLGLIPGLTELNWKRILGGGIAGMAFGLAGGAIGGFGSQLFYDFAGGNWVQDELAQAAIRCAAWGAVGFLIGLAPGLSAGSGEKMGQGMLGGMLGGLTGSLLYLGTEPWIGPNELRIAFILGTIGLGVGTGFGAAPETRPGRLTARKQNQRLMQR